MYAAEAIAILTKNYKPHDEIAITWFDINDLNNFLDANEIKLEPDHLERTYAYIVEDMADAIDNYIEDMNDYWQDSVTDAINNTKGE